LSQGAIARPNKLVVTWTEVRRSAARCRENEIVKQYDERIGNPPILESIAGIAEARPAIAKT